MTHSTCCPPSHPPRYGNDPATELTTAAVEQQKITELRLRKMFGGTGEASPAPAAAARAGRLLAQLAPAAAGLALREPPPRWPGQHPDVACLRLPRTHLLPAAVPCSCC